MKLEGFEIFHEACVETSMYAPELQTKVQNI